MKIFVVLLVLLSGFLVAGKPSESDRMTDEELQQLIAGYQKIENRFDVRFF